MMAARVHGGRHKTFCGGGAALKACVLFRRAGAGQAGAAEGIFSRSYLGVGGRVFTA